MFYVNLEHTWLPPYPQGIPINILEKKKKKDKMHSSKTNASVRSTLSAHLKKPFTSVDQDMKAFLQNWIHNSAISKVAKDFTFYS